MLIDGTNVSLGSFAQKVDANAASAENAGHLDVAELVGTPARQRG